LVVDSENIARPKYVTLGPVVDGLRVVTAGLDPDDRVIVNGLMRARPGVKVTPQEAPDNKAATAGALNQANGDAREPHARLPGVPRPPAFCWGCFPPVCGLVGRLLRRACARPRTPPCPPGQ